MKALLLLAFLLISSSSFSQLNLYYDTGKTINGTGVENLLSGSGKNFGFRTLKDGHLNGEFYKIDTAGYYTIRGKLEFKPDCVNYFSGMKVTSINHNGDTSVLILDSLEYQEVFRYSNSVILKTEPGLAPEIPFTHPDLQIGFADPAVVPVGRWVNFDLKHNYIFTQYDFDDCGNALSIKYFKPDGSILNQYTYEPRARKKKFWYQ